MKTAYYNARVYTGQLPLQEAFIEEDGRFLFAGSTRDALAMIGSGDASVDLSGRFVCSGFIDSHMHLLNYGHSLRCADLGRHTDSLGEMLDYMADFLRQHPVTGSGWLIGRGWNQDYFTDTTRMPDRRDLDRVSTAVPVVAVRACGHCLSVNSRALELLHITADTPRMEGGSIVLVNGEPNGVFLDSAMDLVYNAIPAPDKEELKALLRAACRALNGYGVTGCHSDDYGVFHGVSWQTVNEAYRELEAEGSLTVRVYEQCNLPCMDSLRDFVESGHITGEGSELFRLGPLKLVADGSLGSRTALLSRPYADAPDTVGLAVFPGEVMDALVDYAHAHGMQLAIHAIGDGCVDHLLHAVEGALARHPRPDHRHGIVHCQITRPDQLRRLRELGMHVYAQSIFLDYDSRIVEQRVGRELASSSYAWKTLRSMGVTVSNGTDCPVELPFALGGIQCAVTRAPLRGSAKPYRPEEAFTVEEALYSYTAASAYASFEEQIKGQIAPGMLADFVVLGDDPFTVAPEAIQSIPVYATVLGGRVVYGSLR